VISLDNTAIEQRVGKLETDVAKVSTTVDEHTRLLNLQSEKNDTLNRLTILLEREMSDSKDRERRQELRDEAQNKQLEKFSITLEKVNENLTNLNVRQENLNNKQENLNDRLSDVENTIKGQNINTGIFFKGILKHSLLGLGTLIGGFILAWILFRFGISGGINH
jgi:vacuolar-type H+-ATPase subunit I/STV1